MNVGGEEYEGYCPYYFEDQTVEEYDMEVNFNVGGCNITTNGQYSPNMFDNTPGPNYGNLLPEGQTSSNQYIDQINVNVPIEQNKTINITTNGTQIILPASGFEGFEDITINVNVPQSVSTAYQLVFVKLYQQSRNGLSVLSDVYLSSFQTNTTKTITGNSNIRAQGAYFYYNKNNRQFGVTATGSYGSTNVTFNNGLYYLFSTTLTTTTGTTKIELYGNNGSGTNTSLQSSSGQMSYSFTVNSNILINV